MMTKQGRELPKEVQPEPEFKTYQEFKAWKEQQKIDKRVEKEQVKEAKSE